MATRALLEDEISVLDQCDTDNEQPCCSRQVEPPSASHDDLYEDDQPGIIVTYQGSRAQHLPIPDEDSTSIEEPSNTECGIRTYRTRWYILGVFASLGFIQGYYTLSWNVIAKSVEAVFGWEPKTLTMFQLWLYVTYIVAIYPFAWLMSNKGLRVAVVLTALILSLGTVLRCISVTPPQVTWYTHFSHMLVGISGPVVFAGGPVLSAMWFPPFERATATAVMTISGFAGSAFSFIVGPLLVDEPKPINGSVPAVEWNNSYGNFSYGNYSSGNYSNIPEIKEQILYLRYGECAVCLVLTIMILIHFPCKPKTPPSLTASLDKMDVWPSFVALCGGGGGSANRNFWLIGLAYGSYTGVYAVWSGLMAVNFQSHGVTEMYAGWIGFTSVAVGCVFAVLFGFLVDHCFHGKMKKITMLLIAGCVGSTVWIMLLSIGILTFSKGMLFFACVIQGLCNNAPVPLFYELAIESAYPIPEVATSCMLSILFNVFPLIFCFLFVLDTDAVEYMNWPLVFSLAVCIPLVFFFQEKYKRLAVDTHNEVAASPDGESEEPDEVVGSEEEGLYQGDNTVRARNVSQYGSINI